MPSGSDGWTRVRLDPTHCHRQGVKLQDSLPGSGPASGNTWREGAEPNEGSHRWADPQEIRRRK